MSEPLERFRTFYEEHFPRVHKFLFLRVGDAALAEDLAADVFRKALAAFERHEPERASLTTWVFVIARNALKDHFRWRRLRAFVGLESLEGRGGEPGPAEEAERGESLEALARALGGLADREREILALKFGLRRTNREIAAELGLGESHVGTIVHRALTRLKAALGGGGTR